MSIVRLNSFQSVAGSEEALHNFLLSLIPYILSSKGCKSCEVIQHLEEKATFVVIEKWENVAVHKKSVEEFPKEKMQAAMGLINAPPKGDYFKA